MQNNKHHPALIAITCLFLAGCDSKKDEVFQVARCVMATETVAGASPGDVGIKTGQAVAQYMSEHDLDMSQEEVVALGKKARIDIAGDPELPMPAQIDRAKKIMASEPCKKSRP
ncbi:hypothetical protein BK666_20880 [Pseudomonas frederiksbergensis]|uniref:Lipoprotein n=1 Tax=Pseudomonas frederiksbergensis TaxID=104087 RepID=A0A423JZZ5_9PSED|nr:hypothetical protein [Pseudomonas frederiksbergensis]RON43526.1 hypothetical protein BK666_20880 [Pseudomonas frederiksbergensis]